MKTASLSAIAAAALLLSGCATLTPPEVPMHVAPPQASMPAPATVASHGAIFQAASHRPLFEDHRARLVGDTLTIVIQEQVSASQESNSKLDRSGSLAAGISALPFASTKFLGRTSVDANSELEGKGEGKTDSNNRFSGTITVLVQQVLPNGNLLVVGEKQIGVNQNVDVMRFSGIVNPVNIRSGNVVASTSVAEARLEQRNRGDIGRVQGLGFLSRFFLSIAPV
jgi:flagellar L-ring protein precursor FlgH